ncbi:MAG: BspA family leucine-rich repeat surface protein, partial [Eubacterium sp.]|nr:BspA family leucine-rich repeat surface protein [Eubacterium sp.]
MKMKTTTKRFLILFLAVMAMMVNVNAEKVPYAIYSNRNMTFKYGELPTGQYVYDMSNENYYENWYPIIESIKTITIDSSFEEAQLKSCARMFYKMSNLESIEGLKNINTSQVTDMSFMFTCCNSLKTLDVSGFNTSNVTKMSSMFYECSSLTTLDVSSFNTSNVTNMQSMFSKCHKLTSLNVSGFNTSKVTDMSSMFNACDSLKSLDVSSFNTSNVTNMGSMFDGCQKLKDLDVGNFNTSNVTNMSYMFDYCIRLTSLDLSSFNTSSVTNMKYMFSFCTSLVSLDVSCFNTSNVTDMSCMFHSCTSLTSLDLRGFDTSKVPNTNLMFVYCSKLTTIYCNDKWNCVVSKESAGMFDTCTRLKGAISYNSSKTGPDYANPDTGYFTYKDYDLWVNGTQVTRTNCNDLSVISGVSGTVKFDKYTNTLTLDNATITATGNNTSYAIKSDMPNLKIEVKGNNTLSYTYGGGINSNGSLELSGTDGSSLSVSGPTALVMTSEKENNPIVNDLNLTLDGTSYYGVLSSYS